MFYKSLLYIKNIIYSKDILPIVPRGTIFYIVKSALIDFYYNEKASTYF